MIVSDKQAKRFWTYVDVGPDNVCWLWKGHQAGDYGQYKIGSVKSSSRKNEYAHRVSAFLRYGDIPDGMHVLHKCDVKRCCNPSHLEIGTCSKNHKDAWNRGLRSGPKLSIDDVKHIRASKKRNTDIANEFGLNRNYVSAIRGYKCWECAA